MKIILKSILWSAFGFGTLVLSTESWSQSTIFLSNRLEVPADFNHKVCTDRGYYPLWFGNAVKGLEDLIKWAKDKKLVIVMKNERILSYDNSLGSYPEERVQSHNLEKGEFRNGAEIWDYYGHNLFFAVSKERKEKLYDDGIAQIKFHKGLVLPVTNLKIGTLGHYTVTGTWNINFEVEHKILNRVRISIPYYRSSKNYYNPIDLVKYFKRIEPLYDHQRIDHILELCTTEKQAPEPVGVLELIEE